MMMMSVVVMVTVMPVVVVTTSSTRGNDFFVIVVFCSGLGSETHGFQGWVLLGSRTLGWGNAERAAVWSDGRLKLA